MTKEISTFYYHLHILVLMITDLNPGNFKMNDILGHNKPRSNSEFKAYMEVLEVYGCGYSADIDKYKYRERNSITHA
jgi:hypothetical protein